MKFFTKFRNISIEFGNISIEIGNMSMRMVKIPII